MTNLITAVGEYINKNSKQKINFKQIKMDNYFKGLLFSYKLDDYLISEDKGKLKDFGNKLKDSKFEDYPKKLAKRYTHTKFKKINEKKIDIIKLKDKQYFIIKL